MKQTETRKELLARYKMEEATARAAGLMNTANGIRKEIKAIEKARRNAAIINKYDMNLRGF